MSQALISILLPDLRGGGAERVSLDLAHAFSAAGHKVEFVLMNATGEFLQEARAKFQGTDLKSSKIRHVPIALARYLRAHSPDVLIANMWPLTSAAAIGRAFSRTQTRLLLVDHCAMSQQYATRGRKHDFLMRTSMRFTYRMADHITGVSQGVAADVENLAGLRKGYVSVLHNPIPQRVLGINDVRSSIQSIWNSPNGGRILTVGNLKKQKNHQLLLRAFAHCARTDSTLLLLGQGQNEHMLRAFAKDLGIADRVVFAGFHADPSPFYATADLFVLSSDYEGFGNVIVEALSFGLPVVSTDCPSGPAEILENGRWGRLTPVGDAEALARAMDEALSTPVDREALQRRAADFSPEIAARKYLDLLGLS